MTKKTINKILITFLALLMMLSVSPMAKVAKAESSEPIFAGYFERNVNKLEYSLGDLVLTGITSVTISGSGISGEKALTENTHYIIKSDSVTFKSFNKLGLDLGETYQIKFNLRNGVQVFEILYVTQGIRTVKDIKIFDIDVELISTAKKKVEGYYVLMNNIVIPKGQENQHTGIRWHVWNDTSLDSFKDKYNILMERGFAGTFDGLGHTITFHASVKGFFGCLLPGATIKNVGFTNVTFAGRIYNACGGTFLALNALSRNHPKSPIYLSNIYAQAGEAQQCSGLLWDTQGTEYVKYNNIIVKLDGDVTTFNQPMGCISTYEGGYGPSYGNGGREQRYANFKDVYTISMIPVARYTDDSGRLAQYYGENVKVIPETVEVPNKNDPNTTVTQSYDRFKNVRSYASYIEMLNDEANDYSTFDTRYWDVETYGVPLWREASSEYKIEVQTDATISSSNMILTIGKEDSAIVYLGFFGMPVEDAEFTNEFISQSDDGSYSYEDGIVSVSADGLIKAIKPGRTKINLKFTYNGETYEKAYTITVKENPDPIVPDDPNQTDDPADSKGGCGTVTFDHTDFTGGALIIAGAFTFMMIRRKKKEN